MADMQGERTIGYVHSIETFGSVDGPGVRFVVFLKGCPMRCSYCHNPDTWTRDGAEPMTADELLDRADRYRAYWGPEGGITVSGGEALLQIDFLIELFDKAHRRGIHTCLDTSGQPFTQRKPWLSKFDRLMLLTDLVLLDLKHIRDDAHRRLTGHSNRNILDCARHLSELGRPVWVRHVLVPGITDDEALLEELAAFIATLKNVERVEVLPYHALGVYKYEQLGLDYPLREVPAPDEESLHRARRILGAE